MKRIFFILIFIFPLTVLAQVQGILKEETKFYFSTEAGTSYAGTFKTGDTLNIVGFTPFYAIIERKDRRIIYVYKGSFIITDEIENFQKELLLKEEKENQVLNKQRAELETKKYNFYLKNGVD